MYCWRYASVLGGQLDSTDATLATDKRIQDGEGMEPAGKRMGCRADWDQEGVEMAADSPVISYAPSWAGKPNTELLGFASAHWGCLGQYYRSTFIPLPCGDLQVIPWPLWDTTVAILVPL